MIKKGDEAKVIHLTRSYGDKHKQKNLDKEAAEECFTGVSPFLAKYAVRSRGQRVRRFCTSVIHIKQKLKAFKIEKSPLAVFGHKDERGGTKLRYLRYSYSNAKTKHEIMEGARHLDEVDRGRTAEVAKFFAEAGNSGKFGLYHIRDWNCEHFATFCKTFKKEKTVKDNLRELSAEDLNKYMLNDGNSFWHRPHFSRDYLKEKLSQATSYQTELRGSNSSQKRRLAATLRRSCTSVGDGSLN